MIFTTLVYIDILERKSATSLKNIIVLDLKYYWNYEMKPNKKVGISDVVVPSP